MNLVQHAVIGALVARHHRPQAAALSLLPDLPNVLLLVAPRWLPEADWRVRASRIAHSPLIAIVALLVGCWPVTLHWLCDLLTHEPRRVLWPFIR